MNTLAEELEIIERQIRRCEAQFDRGIITLQEQDSRVYDLVEQKRVVERTIAKASHAADESGWVVTVSGDGYVQVSTSCKCGDVECSWHAGEYRTGWVNA